MTLIDSKIIGSSQPAVALKKMIAILAKSDAPVIINGPTGSGKELVAEALHEESRRKGKFVALNCAAIPSELIEAEIFGFEKGAFTGAIKTTQGKFEQANKGTLFLDEIGDMPHNLQTKLLRVLEKSTISRVGGDKEIGLDVRIVCATHKNLENLVGENKFREDLLFRLNVFPIDVPSLSSRVEDIPDLIDHFFDLKSRNSPNQRPSFSDEAIETLKTYSWPGNIREVRNVIERAITFFPAQTISRDDLNKFLISINPEVIDLRDEQNSIWNAFETFGQVPDSDAKGSHDKSPPQPEDFTNWFNTNNSVDIRKLLRDIEIVLIKAALDRNDGNSSEAAKDLKLLRTTLIEKMKKYGL
jgi:sigma-54 specific flagellar transcriptional regulator A